MVASVKIEGLEVFKSRLAALGRKARPAMRRTLTKTGKPIVKQFRSDAPVKTGATKRSIGITRLKDGSIKVGVRYNFKDPKTGRIPNKYAVKVDQKRNWFGPAWDQIKDNVSKEMLSNLARELTRVEA
jgi:hypothetical protein